MEENNKDFCAISQSDYDAIIDKDLSIIYFTTDTYNIYIGDKFIANIESRSNYNIINQKRNTVKKYGFVVILISILILLSYIPLVRTLMLDLINDNIIIAIIKILLLIILFGINIFLLLFGLYISYDSDITAKINK